MKTTADRIKEALDLRGMKQADLVEKTGIGKSSISTYISGSYEPKQRNIYKIAKALDVSEPWLMGFDVPMERTSMSQSDESPVMKALLNSDNKNSAITEKFIMKKLADNIEFESLDFHMLSEFKKLNTEGKKEAINRIMELTFVPKYAKDCVE
jgi:transcriptional regulator with XRE-family HTH domain